MSFVKLDDGILDSSLWVDGDSTRLFIAALLLARPQEFKEPIEQMAVRGFDKTGFVAPPGWYGFIPASGSGLIRRALLDSDQGLKALENLCSADEESRSCEFEGRRLARVPDGYVVLNFMKYRDKDHTASERQKRLRGRKKAQEVASVTDVTRDERDVTRDITQSESESESESLKTLNTLVEVSDSDGAISSKKNLKGESDPRHTPFREAIGRYWQKCNPSLEMPWGGADGKALSLVLKASPGLSLESFTGLLRSRYASEGVNHSERPHQWLSRVTNYASGPLNTYGKPKTAAIDQPRRVINTL